MIDAAKADAVVATDDGVEAPKTLKEEILALHDQRTAVEVKVSEALAYLDTTPVGMEEPLLDPEGFPRDDCDLFAVRTARNAVICGRNDLRAIDDALYVKLGELHEDTKAEAEAQMAADEEARRRRNAEAELAQRQRQQTEGMRRLRPLLKVASVEPGSPAAEAGLKRGFLIVQYGGLNAETLSERGGLASIPKITAESKDTMLSVWVREDAEADTEAREVFLVPQEWSGKGLLGCALDPI